MDKYVDTDIGIYHVIAKCQHKDKDGHALYHVKCRFCDFESDMRLFNIKTPTICKHKDRHGNLIDFKTTWKDQRLANIFSQMQDRCFNVNDKSYRWYGEKGITICTEWLENPHSFEEWALNNGYEPGLTIDRIDSSKDYCPENCQWIPLSENTRKAGNVNWITVDDITLTGKQWAQTLNIGINTINKAVRAYGIDKTRELISAMRSEPPSTKRRELNQSWMDVYGIQI